LKQFDYRSDINMANNDETMSSVRAELLIRSQKIRSLKNVKSSRYVFEVMNP